MDFVHGAFRALPLCRGSAGAGYGPVPYGNFTIDFLWLWYIYHKRDKARGAGDKTGGAVAEHEAL